MKIDNETEATALHNAHKHTHTKTHARGRYSTIITAIICIGRYLKTKSNGNINRSAVTRIWLARTLFVPIARQIKRPNETNEIQCISFIVSIGSSIRPDTEQTTNREKSKLKTLAKTLINENNKNKYYEGLTTSNEKTKKKNAVE